MKLSLGFSPCPNDTFIFDALVNKKIDTEGLEFEAVLEDIQTLNEWSNSGKLDITKLSCPAFFANADKYAMLNLSLLKILLQSFELYLQLHHPKCK